MCVCVHVCVCVCVYIVCVCACACMSVCVCVFDVATVLTNTLWATLWASYFMMSCNQSNAVIDHCETHKYLIIGFLLLVKWYIYLKVM